MTQEHNECNAMTLTTNNIDMESSSNVYLTSNETSTSSSSSSSCLWSPARTRLIALCCVLTTVASSQTLLVQPFKKGLISHRTTPLHMPFYLAFIDASSFPLSIILYIITVITISSNNTAGTKTSLFSWPKRSRLTMYFLLGFLDACDTIACSFGLAMLPPGVYTVVKSSSLIWAVLLARLTTSKHMTLFHYAGAALLFTSTVLIALCSPWCNASGTIDVSMMMGFTGTLLASFSTALIGVLTYKFFTRENIKGSLIDVAELAAFQAMFMFIFVAPIAVMTPEAKTWHNTFSDIRSSGTMFTFKALSISLYICRPLMMFSDMGVTAHSSNVMTRALSGGRRVIVIVIGWYIWREQMKSVKIFAITVMLIGFCVYVYGGFRVQQKKSSLKIVHESKKVTLNTIS